MKTGGMLDGRGRDAERVEAGQEFGGACGQVGWLRLGPASSGPAAAAQGRRCARAGDNECSSAGEPACTCLQIAFSGT